MQGSLDGQLWTDLYTEKNGQGGVSDVRFAAQPVRHLRITCLKRATQWGHAIRELQTFE